MTSDPHMRLRRAAEQAIDGERILDALDVLSATPSPHGQERATADRMAGWAATRWPQVGWRVDPVGPAGANLVGSSALDERPELLIYSHLDTSLTGDPVADEPITGSTAPIAPLSRPGADGLISGFGLGVARGAAAAALVGYAAAVTACRATDLPHRLTLLLASAGTHRHHSGPSRRGGVEQHLDRNPLPAAAIVAKSGPPGILTEEPGAMFLRVRVGTRFHPVLARQSALPPGGLISHLGAVVELLEAFRRRHLAARARRSDQIAAEVGIGHVQAGLASKPDLLPGVVEFHLYLVTVPGDDEARIANELRSILIDGLRDGPLEDCTVTVDGWLTHAAAATPAHAPIARQAHAAWGAVHGQPPASISGWRGSTDGVVFRGRGVDTVRLGPSAGPDPADPRRDRCAVPDLVRFARLYAEIALRHATASTNGGTA
ncbi:hypothetical protein [Dactylosporangium sp. CA-233914]|uniref:hypothetical protein n=1 Tax=Dactylosporangium sp. CA-233914 TaxID=3239934 RepID=UPI003D8FB611